jgi:hypothetical protein
MSVRKGEKRPDLYRARVGICPICHKDFRAVKDFKERKQKYCSKECWSVRSPKIESKCLNCLKPFMAYSGRKVYCDKKCRDTHYKIRLLGSASPQWKGAQAGYSAKHKRLTSKYGKPTQCAACNKTAKYIDWANLSGEYKEDITDWIRLCRKCHKWLDTRKGKDRTDLVSRWCKYTGKQDIKRNGEPMTWTLQN